MVAFSDMGPHADSTTGDVYTTATGGTVNAIQMDSGKKFVEIGLLKNTSGLNEALTKDSTKGISFFTQTFTLVLGDVTIENKAFVESVMNQPVAVIIKTRTGKYFAAGLNGLFELASAEGGTGVAETDLIGYTLTFSGLSTGTMKLVDPSIVAGLIA
ncbi:MAG: hypothetical protein EOO46_16495 [Flavobacterium sp.]|nr:MAG: hypothetical protein EOO46_16495 [Flavobacterium sp.]